MEFLKDILGDELYGQVEEKLKGNDKVKLANLADGGYISKAKFDAETGKVRDLTTQLGDRDTQLKNLQTVDADKLNAEIIRLQGENQTQKETYDKQIKSQAKDYAIAEELRSAKAKNANAVKALLDDSKITYKDGNIEGLSDQLKSLKEKESYLFDVEDKPKFNGLTPGEGGDKPPQAGAATSLKGAIAQHYKGE